VSSIAKRPNPIKKTTTVSSERFLIKSARLLARGVSPLFHGTRYLSQILRCGALRAAEIGDCVVCFTRSPEEAAFWATLKRDDGNELGAVLVFDRDRLRTRYRLDAGNASELRDEHEERVWFRDISLGCALIGVVEERPLQISLGTIRSVS
jgi:hypothetical protein